MGDSRKIQQVRSSRQVPVRVKLLDDDIFNHSLDKRSNGLLLFDKVCEHLNILEKDYFGLNYIDPTGEKYWLSNDKKIAKQLKGQNWDFKFEVKFYPADPSQLVEDLTRYQLCLQIRRDIIEGKLPCSFVTYTLLGSYTVQSELGDYDPEEFGSGYKYLKDIQFAPHQDKEMLSKIAELHKQHKGQTPEEAEMHFLSNAKKVALYGVEMHHMQDAEGKDIQLGVCASGLIVFKDKVQINRFVWPKVLKLSYKRNKFYVKVRPGEFENSASLISFHLPDVKLAKRLWKICVEHHSFFRFREPEVPKSVGILPRLGSRFRFSGRTQYQSRQMVSQENREAPSFDRVMSKRGTFAGRTQNMKKRDEDRQQMREKKRRPPTAQTQPGSNSTDTEHPPEPKHPPPKAPKPSGQTKGRGPASVDSNASLDRSRESLNDLVDVPLDRKSKMEKMHAVATPLAAIFQQSIDRERLEKEKEDNDRREHERDMHEDDDHHENEEVDGRSITPEITDQDVAPVQSHPPPPMTDRDRKAFAKQEKERVKREKEAEKRRKKEEEMERKRLEKERKKHQAEEKAAMQKKSKQKGPTRDPEHDPRYKNNNRGMGREWDQAHSNDDHSPATPERTTKRLSSLADKHERNRDREDSDEDQPPTPPAPLSTAFKGREKRVDHSQSPSSESDISDDEHKDVGKHRSLEPEDEQEEISF